MTEKVDVICPECGEVMEVTDIRAFLLAVHQANACYALEPLMGAHG